MAWDSADVGNAVEIGGVIPQVFSGVAIFAEAFSLDCHLGGRRLARANHHGNDKNDGASEATPGV